MDDEELAAIRARWAQLDPPDRDRVQTVVDLAKADVAALLARCSRAEAEVERLRGENTMLRAQIQRLTDTHGTFPYMGYKSELKGL